MWLLLLCIGASSAGLSSLAGVWQNELGSQMYLEHYRQTILDGWYNSSVGQALGTYPLVGFIGAAGATEQVLCFSVLWQNNLVNTNSATTWNGVYDGSAIRTTWLLRSGDDTWNATTVGNDIFQRVK